MNKLLYFFLGLLIISTFILFYCTDPENPFTNINDVEIQVAIPERIDSLLWKVNDSVLIEVDLHISELIDSVRINFGENDSTFTININALTLPDDTTLVQYIVYLAEGLKNIKVTAFIPGSDTGKSAEAQVNIGIKPLIGNDKKVQRPLNAYIDSSFYMYITSDGTEPLTFNWYKNVSIISRAKNDTLKFDTLTFSDSGFYYCIVRNAWGFDTSLVDTLRLASVIIPPTITVQPSMQAVTEGQTAVFNVTATGTAPLNYQWQKDSVNITGATNFSYTTPATTLSDSGSVFRCIVSNTVGADTSDQALLKVNKDAIAPTITTQPQLQSITEGQTAIFSVVVTGTAPLTYQWQKNSSDISGATDSSYTTPVTTLSDSGSLFRCIVSNSAGSDTSDNAMLIVNTNPVAPTITTHPTEQSVTEGQTAAFIITATGTTPITYQWQKDGTDISGATNTSYTTPATTMSDSGSQFRCIVSNSAGADTSDNALLKVNQDIVAPLITIHPVLQSVGEGQTATFSVRAAGTAPLSYQWQKDDADISGATDSNYTTPATILSDSGAQFRCIVSNAAGADTSDKALLQVSQNPIAPTITTQPVLQSVTEGETATFSIIATGTAQLSYQWQKGGADIAGATNSSYTTPATTLTDSGSVFRCIVCNIAGADTSDNAMLIVNSAPVKPTITTQPKPDTALEGETGTFSVAATGTSPLSYQWQKGGTDISGATNSSYTTPAVTKLDNGAVYRCIVSNSVGKDTSDNAMLTVNLKPPVITVDPVVQSVTEGETASFSVTATGTDVTYQWQKNNANISSATSSDYTTPATTMADDGATFRCIVSNTGGKDTSATATLTVNMKAPVISADPADRNVNEGQNATFYVTATGTALHYEWQKDGTPITSAPDQDSYTLTTTWQDNGATFRCRVYNTGGSVNSQTADLVVNHTPKITQQPSAGAKRIDDAITLTVAATGNPTTLTYEWFFNDVSVSIASSYTISSVEPQHEGIYYVRVTNTMGTTQSDNVNLTVTMEFEDKRDGQIYKVVEAEGKLWIAENLRYVIPITATDTSWTHPVDPKFGRFYNEAAMRNAAPPGWRMPDYFGDIDPLISSGGTDRIKAKPSEWNGSDIYGLRFLPSGYRECSTGEHVDFNSTGGLWNYNDPNYLHCSMGETSNTYLT